jgi:sterol desaturase/sphingolipid hydroxylase (fatty acid hydroxylase superfamily)
MSAIPASVREFREAYRANYRKKFYSGELHMIWTFGILLGAIGWHLWQVRGATWLDLLVLPATLVFGNWVEYTVHRYPLHNIYPGLRPVYEIHSLNHHRFYNYDAMAFESFRDFMMVLFPPWAPALVIAFTSSVGFFLVRPLVSANAGHFFAAAGTAGLLFYEVLHALAHCSDESFAGRLPLVQGVRRHHRLHHDLALMSRWNFNITFPWFDRLLGTEIRVRSPRRTAASPAATAV